MLCGLQYSCCIDLLPLLFLISSSRVVTRAGPPWSCGKAGCPPCRGIGNLSIESPHYFGLLLYTLDQLASWLITPPSCISPLEPCISVSSLFLCLPILNIPSTHLSGDWYLSSTKGQAALCHLTSVLLGSLFLSAQLNPKGTHAVPPGISRWGHFSCVLWYFITA